MTNIGIIDIENIKQALDETIMYRTLCIIIIIIGVIFSIYLYETKIKSKSYSYTNRVKFIPQNQNSYVTNMNDNLTEGTLNENNKLSKESLIELYKDDLKKNYNITDDKELSNIKSYGQMTPIEFAHIYLNNLIQEITNYRYDSLPNSITDYINYELLYESIDWDGYYFEIDNCYFGYY